MKLQAFTFSETDIVTTNYQSIITLGTFESILDSTLASQISLVASSKMKILTRMIGSQEKIK